MKKLVSLSLLFITVLTLTACGGGQNKTLSSLTITGIEDISISKDETFDVLEGVKVTGNDLQDYTSEIEIHSSTCGFYDDSMLYTNTAKNCDITYIVLASGIYKRETRIIEIK